MSRIVRLCCNARKLEERERKTSDLAMSDDNLSGLGACGEVTMLRGDGMTN